MSAFSERIRLARNGENQATFAARFGLKVAVYSHYENGRREPSLDTVVSIARVLGVTTDYLLGVDGSKPSGIISVANGGVVAIGDGAKASGRVTIAAERSDCKKCPYKLAVKRLQKAGMNIAGIEES